MNKKTLLKAKSLNKSFKQGTNIIQVLDNTDFELLENEVIAVIGPSGCGKTTFLHIIGLLDLPDSGEIIMNKKNFVKSSDKQRTIFRKNNIGFIYQSHNLLNDFTALENVMLPLRLHNVPIKEAKKIAENLLKKLNLKDRANHFPSQLSGGEQQRVAIARSLAPNPQIILADEPTGNLDQENAKKVLKLLLTTIRNLKKSMVIVTHNTDVAKLADRMITIKNGNITAIKK